MSIKQAAALAASIGLTLALPACSGAPSGSEPAPPGEESARVASTTQAATAVGGGGPRYTSDCLATVPLATEWDHTAYNSPTLVWIQLSGYPGDYGVYGAY